MRRPGLVARILAAWSVAALTGCMAPHNDVLLFGTTTKVAFDITAPPEGTYVPEITLGYKRKEFVWMPLVLNGRGSSLDEGATWAGALGAAAKYTAEAETQFVGNDGNPKGEKLKSVDTYSVLASFGGEFSGEAGLQGEHGTSTMNAGLAQVFATGIAAQRLADNPNIVRALAVQPADAEIADAAKETAKAEKERADAVTRLLEAETRTSSAIEGALPLMINPATGKVDDASGGNLNCIEGKLSDPSKSRFADMRTAIAGQDAANVRATMFNSYPDIVSDVAAAAQLCKQG